jgi:hypothetical protein
LNDSHSFQGIISNHGLWSLVLTGLCQSPKEDKVYGRSAGTNTTTTISIQDNGNDVGNNYNNDRVASPQGWIYWLWNHCGSYRDGFGNQRGTRVEYCCIATIQIQK